MKRRNRHYYCEQISRAVRFSNHGKKLHGNELYFFDYTDWESDNKKGTWTDVHLRIGDDSVFAFTVFSSINPNEGLAGSVPESLRDLETGTWNLYIHKKYITEEDAGFACKKWLALQGPVNEICLGCNVYFNGKPYGHEFCIEQYPPTR